MIDRNESPERIGIEYKKPFSLFSSIFEHPDHPEMIYCKGKDEAHIILLDMKQQALDEAERQYFLEHKKIDEMEV